MRVEPLCELVCPLDGMPLQCDARLAQCAAGHGFDRAREGYFNLLPAQYKASRDPGDDKAMVMARRRTLDDGLFAPLAAALFEHVREAAQAKHEWPPLRVVDAGCGEGYYLAYVEHAAQHCADDVVLALAGYDISKWAVRAAARRSPGIVWVVASNRQPPFLPAGVDLLLSLFGFPHWSAFARLLSLSGRVLTVDAAADHLLELRQVIYPKVEMAAMEPVCAALAQGWRVQAQRRLSFHSELRSAAAIQALVAMTPHAHRISADGRAALAERTELTVTMSVVLRELAPPLAT